MSLNNQMFVKTGFPGTFVFAFVLACLSFCLSGCAPRTEARRDNCQIKVGIVFDIGGKNDRSFNAAAWEGRRLAYSHQCPRLMLEQHQPHLHVLHCALA